MFWEPLARKLDAISWLRVANELELSSLEANIGTHNLIRVMTGGKRSQDAPIGPTTI